MKFASLVFVSLFFVLSCKKANFTLDLTNHTDRKIVAEGFFTDSLQKQFFSFKLSSNIQDDSIEYPTDVELTIETSTGIEKFSSVGEGVFESDNAFQGIYGQEYKIKFIYKDQLYETSTTMPQPATINQYMYNTFEIGTFTAVRPQVKINITSPIDQYLKANIYKADKNYLPEDTLWISYPIPVYSIVKVPIGSSNTITLPFSSIDGLFVQTGDLIKVETKIISQETGEYLLKLKKYILSELANNQSYNPPYYYSNGAYGLGYGTILKTDIRVY